MEGGGGEGDKKMRRQEGGESGDGGFEASEGVGREIGRGGTLGV